MHEGRRYQQEGRPREAAIEFANAVRLLPNDVEAHTSLADAYTASGATQLAIFELGTVLQLQPENVPARVDLGTLLLKSGQGQQALVQARWIALKQPANAAAQELLASAASVAGSREEALKAAEAAVALAPQRADYRTQRATLLLVDPRLRDEAFRELSAALKMDPHFVPARAAMAQLLEARGDSAGAEQQLEQAVRLTPRSVQARVSFAALLQRAGDLARAEQVLRKATDDLSDDPDAAPLLERFFQQTGHPDRSVPAYRELASRHPNSLALQVAYVRVLMTDGDMATARPRLGSLVREHGSDPDVTLVQSYALMRDGKSEAAVNLLQPALQQYPERSDLLVAFGRAQEEDGRTQDALSAFRRAAQINVSAIEPQRAFAEFAYRNNNAAALRDAAEQLVLQHPGLADGYVWRGVAEMLARQPQLAVVSLQEALKRSPAHVFAATELGIALRALGAKDKAQAEFERVLQTVPDPGAAEALSELLIADGKTQTAVAMVQTQVLRAPRSAEMLQVLAQVQVAADDSSGAIGTARRAMELQPGDRSALQVFTQASLNSGQLDEPVQQWQRWTADHPADPHGPAALGALYESAGDFKAAMDWYRRSLSLQANQPVISAAVASLMAETGGNLDVALSMAQSAYQAAPDSPQTADAVGWIDFRKGFAASALAPLRAAAAADPSNATILFHLGSIEAAMGQGTAARADLQRARVLAGDSSVAEDIQKTLSRLDGKGA